MTKNYLLLTLRIFGFFLLIFLVFQAFSFPVLTDPSHVLSGDVVIAAVSSFVLLSLDIILPVPSSILMISNGALFGIFTGTLISLAGGMVSTCLGFWLGRKGEKWFKRFLTEKDQLAAKKVLSGYGIVAIIITRPMPLLAETVSVMAGASKMKWKSLLFASFLGYLPASLIYALTGIWATDFKSGLLSFAVVIAVAGIFWLLSRQMNRII